MFTFGENRPAFLMKEVWPNLKTYGRDVNQEYLAGPWRRRDPIQKVIGPVMAFASVLLEGNDQLLAGAVDQRLTPPSGIAGRVRRDTKSLLKNVVTFHPLRAGGDLFRLAFADVPLDIGDTLGGFRLQERSNYAAVLSEKDADYSLAA